MTGSIKKGGEQTFYAVRCESRKLFLFHKGGHQRYNKRRDGIFQYHRIAIVMLESGLSLRWRVYLRILSLDQAQARIMGNNLRHERTWRALSEYSYPHILFVSDSGPGLGLKCSQFNRTWHREVSGNKDVINKISFSGFNFQMKLLREIHHTREST